MYRAPVLRLLTLCCLFWTLLATAQTTPPPQDFSIVLLPDTQFYSENHPAIFNSQTQWIVDNRAAWNIQFVIGEGDIVNTPSYQYEWVNADTAIKTLDNAAIPYALAIGNHDYDGIAPSKRQTTAYNQWFGVSRYSGYSWYGGSYNGTNENFYTFFTVNGQRYLVFALEFYPRDAVLTWATSIANANPDAKVILVTHSFVLTDGTRVDKCDNNDMSNAPGNPGEAVWEKFLSHIPGATLAVSGHLVKTHSAWTNGLGDNGNLVTQIFTNFQNWTNGGNGYLRILKFRPSINKIEVYTYSTYLKSYLTDGEDQFTLPLTNDGNTATTGNINGKVHSTTCTAVANATVTAGGITTTTDSNGHYTISGLTAPYQYATAINASGYVSQTKNANVAAGYGAQTDFYLAATSTGVASCTLSTTNPSVTICTPAANATVTSPVHVNAGTTSSVGVQYMQIYVDGVKQKTYYASSLDDNVSMATGTRKLTVQAHLSNGTTVKKTIYITVSGTTSGGGGGTTSGVTMTSPVNGSTVSNPVKVSATATSNVAISYMQVYVDGIKVYQVYSNTLNTSLTLATGSRKVTVQAKDANGIYYKQTAYITVQ